MKKLTIILFAIYSLTASAQVGDFESYEVNIYQGSADTLFTVVLSDNRSDKAKAWQNVTADQTRDVLFSILEQQTESEIKARVEYELSKARTAKIKESMESLGLTIQNFIGYQSRKYTADYTGRWEMSSGGESTVFIIGDDLTLNLEDGEKEGGRIEILGPLSFIAHMKTEDTESGEVKIQFLKFAPGFYLAAGTSDLIMKKL